MAFILNILLVLQILSAAVMVGLVLMQHGKGADMGASFGSGASGSLFGATGSANFLSRSTALAATVFFVCTLAQAWAGTRVDAGASSGAGVMGQLAAAPAAPHPASAPAAIAQIPAAAGSVAKH